MTYGLVGIIPLMNGKFRESLLYLLLTLTFLIPRLPALGSFATLDEPAWLTMGANFYYALGQREFQKTVYEYQPAVTTMWVVTAGMLATYPEYRGLGQGYMDYEKESLDTFMTAHGMDPLALLRNSRLIQVLIITFLLLVSFALLRRLVGLPLALASILLASFEPFYLGQSRLLNHEAMLVCFIAISFFALAVYLFKDRKMLYLLISGVSAGFAQLTKSSGIALLAPVGLMLLIHLYQNRNTLRASLWNVVKTFGLWLVALALTYVIFWPGMWVAPRKMLYEVYANAFSFAFRGARLIALEETAPAPAHLDSGLAGIAQQLYTILWRTPVTTWMGVILAAGPDAHARPQSRSPADAHARLVGRGHRVGIHIVVRCGPGTQFPALCSHQLLHVQPAGGVGLVYGFPLAGGALKTTPRGIDWHDRTAAGAGRQRAWPGIPIITVIRTRFWRGCGRSLSRHLPMGKASIWRAGRWANCPGRRTRSRCHIMGAAASPISSPARRRASSPITPSRGMKGN